MATSKTQPGDDDGAPGTVTPANVGWTAGDVQTRLATHLTGAGSPLIRAAVDAGVNVQLAAAYPGSRFPERRLKRWHKTGQFCPTCPDKRGGRAR